jgi:LysM repeat protein
VAPEGAQPDAMAPPASPGGTPLYHEVKSGETLFRISRVYGVPVTQLKEWNQLRDNTIEVGQRLIVGYQ